MYKFRNSFSKTILAVVLLASNSCWAGFIFELQNSLNFAKTDVTIENLDRGDFKETACTTDWTSNKEFLTYLLNGELIYVDSRLPFYAKFAANYGWVINGRVIQYPLNWDADGYEKGCTFEAGYIIDVNQRFKFIPHIGFEYDTFHTKIKHQHFNHTSPNSFVDQSGNKSNTTLYYPYIGVELDFTSRFYDCYDIQFSTTYEIGYVSGHGGKKVPHFFVTDDPNTSRYGSHIKYRDMISHFFEVTASYKLSKKWQIGVEGAYDIVYNTHKLPFKLQRNEEIVETGQFTPTQYHVVSDYTAQTYSLIFTLVYNFSGEGGTYLR